MNFHATFKQLRANATAAKVLKLSGLQNVWFRRLHPFSPFVWVFVWQFVDPTQMAEGWSIFGFRTLPLLFSLGFGWVYLRAILSFLKARRPSG